MKVISKKNSAKKWSTSNPWAIPLAFVSFLFCGGILSFPGVILDILLVKLSWTPATFGWGLFVQGLFALLGTQTMAQHIKRRKDYNHATLTGLAQLFPAAGIGLLYFTSFWITGQTLTFVAFLGFSSIGFGVGASTLLNNSVAFSSGHVPRTLNILNMAYTVGAVLMPGLTAALLTARSSQTPDPFISLEGAPELLQGSVSSSESWLMVAGALALGFVVLALVCLKSGRSQAAMKLNETKCSALASEISPSHHEIAPSTGFKSTPFGIWPLCCAAVVMCCYVGTEINLSNYWVPYLKEHLANAADSLRLASPLYWLGLFISRFYFSIFAPQSRNISKFITFFGVGSAATIIVMILSVDFIAHHPQFLQNLSLSLAFASGLFIGSTYSFTLGALTHYYTETPLARRATGIIIQWGVIGAISFPPALGMIAQRFNTGGAMVFILCTQFLFSLAALIWLNLKPRPLIS